MRGGKFTYRDLAFNAQGYYDETAYKAIKNIQEEKIMSEFYNGDIWTMQKADGRIYEVLILATHGNYATVLTLLDREPQENCVTIKSKATMYADTGKVNYVFYDKLLDFVKAMPEPDFVKVLRKVGTSLNMGEVFAEMPVKAPQSPIIPQETEKPANPAPQEEKTLHTPVNATVIDADRYQKMQMQLVAAEKERDIYKELFYKAFPQIGGIQA